LKAFMMYNEVFGVLMCQSYLHYECPEAIKNMVSCYDARRHFPASLWLVQKSDLGASFKGGFAEATDMLCANHCDFISILFSLRSMGLNSKNCYSGSSATDSARFTSPFIL